MTVEELSVEVIALILSMTVTGSIISFIYFKAHYKRQASQIVPILYVGFGADCFAAACLRTHSDSCTEVFGMADGIHI